jgi:phospholipid/cholesterol/gamma-HCH transport system permease protein
MRIIESFGKYLLFLKEVFRRPQKYRIAWRQFVFELKDIGLNSVWIVSLMSVFIGAVITLQTASNIDDPLVSPIIISFTTRQSMVLEFSPTIIALILTGKVGSSIASQLGTMRITEQIDALTMMGVRSASFLVMPKIFAAMFFFPFLVTISMFLGIAGGWVFGVMSGVITTVDYIGGLRLEFDPFSYTYAMIKTVVFAFLITSVASFKGYYAKGSALEVARASTQAVVDTSIAILVANYMLTQILLL